MGLGIDLAKEDSPDHAEVMENFRDQLLVTLIKREVERSGNGKAVITLDEVDSNGSINVSMAVVDGSFEFEIKRKH
jgi:hypothetical protein